MHPILLRIPLPHVPLKYWWALVAVAVIAAINAALGARKSDKSQLSGGILVLVAAGVAAWFLRGKSFEAPFLPLYSYGVMLGLSLVAGWYLTLNLADRDKLPKEEMANCYVITAICALVGSRVLYVLTNLDDFHTVGSWFDIRLGGLVAYGGFIGGFLGSWWYCNKHRIRLMAWADDVGPSLGIGLFVTRIGCYLFGCDFGKRLPDGAPGWLKSAGTFPHWPAGTVAVGDGSPAYVRHLEVFQGTPMISDLTRTNASFPVHPTQIYESLLGLTLMFLCLNVRRTQRFRGQVFLIFVFAYGYARFLLEILRDDAERGDVGPAMSEHVLIPFAMIVMSAAFAYGPALGIKNLTARMVARVVAFLPPVLAYFLLKPPSFGSTVLMSLSTSQGIGMVTAALAGFFYAKLWEESRKDPRGAMSLGEGAETSGESSANANASTDDEESSDEAPDETEHAAPEGT